MTQVLIFWNRMALISLLGMSSLVAGDWQAWRGPNGNGIAGSDAKPPSEWGEEKNVKWKVIIPGRGHASPAVCGDLIVVATATDDAQFVIAYDRESGNIRWKQRVHNGGLPDNLHKKTRQPAPRSHRTENTSSPCSTTTGSLSLRHWIEAGIRSGGETLGILSVTTSMGMRPVRRCIRILSLLPPTARRDIWLPFKRAMVPRFGGRHEKFQQATRPL